MMTFTLPRPSMPTLPEFSLAVPHLDLGSIRNRKPDLPLGKIIIVSAGVTLITVGAIAVAVALSKRPTLCDCADCYCIDDECITDGCSDCHCHDETKNADIEQPEAAPQTGEREDTEKPKSTDAPATQEPPTTAPEPVEENSKPRRATAPRKRAPAKKTAAAKIQDKPDAEKDSTDEAQ